MICLGNKFSWRRIWGSDQLLRYDSCEISCHSTAVVALKYRPESVRHGRLQRDAISPRPRMMSLLNSNELCAIKNGGIQLISLPLESVLRSCGRKHPGCSVGMTHDAEQSGNKLYLVLAFIFVFYMETNHLRLATWIWAPFLQ